METEKEWIWWGHFEERKETFKERRETFKEKREREINMLNVFLCSELGYRGSVKTYSREKPMKKHLSNRKSVKTANEAKLTPSTVCWGNGRIH